MFICQFEFKSLPLHGSLKRSGTLLRSNPMRNRAVQNDKYGQGSLSTRPLHFHAILRVSAHAKENLSAHGYAVFALMASSL